MGSAQSCTALGPCDCRQRRRVTLYQSTVKLAVFTFDNDERDAHTFCNEFSEFKTPCFRKVILFSYKTLWEIVSEYFSCLLLQVIKNISTRTKKNSDPRLAAELDKRDKLAEFRDKFHVPIISDYMEGEETAEGRCLSV